MPTAQWKGKTIAQSDDTVIVDGNHYFPANSLDRKVIEESETTSICGWKGTAKYYTLNVDGLKNVDAAWYYPDPKPQAANIKGRVAFWKGVEVS